MPMLREKPVEIEARRVPIYPQPHGRKTSIVAYVDECVALAEWCGGRSHMMNAADSEIENHILIPTLEGDMRALPGDWIIVFTATYEPVTSCQAKTMRTAAVLTVPRTDERCPSCEHQAQYHDADGRCWFTVEQGVPERDSVCSCWLRRMDDETRPAHDPSWPRRAWDLGLLHKGGDPHHCPACLAQPEPPPDFVCPGAEANAAVLANPQPTAGA